MPAIRNSQLEEPEQMAAEVPTTETYLGCPIMRTPPSSKTVKRMKANPTHIKRPRNPFLIFQSWLVHFNLVPRDNKKIYISEFASKQWSELELNGYVRRAFERLAEEEKEEHSKMYPDYRYTYRRKKAEGSSSHRDDKPEATTMLPQQSDSRPPESSKARAMNVPDRVERIEIDNYDDDEDDKQYDSKPKYLLVPANFPTVPRPGPVNPPIPPQRPHLQEPQSQRNYPIVPYFTNESEDKGYAYVASGSHYRRIVYPNINIHPSPRDRYCTLPRSNGEVGVHFEARDHDEEEERP